VSFSLGDGLRSGSGSGAAAVAAFGLVDPSWHLGAMALVLLLAGMTRSMQFTSLNTVAFVDIPMDARTGATTLAAMSQQISSAAAIAFAALVLATSQSLRGGQHLESADFRSAFVACGVLLALSRSGC